MNARLSESKEEELVVLMRALVRTEPLRVDAVRVSAAAAAAASFR